MDRNIQKVFFERLLQQDTGSPTFFSWILLIEEACFTRNGIFNAHNQYTWAVENPHSFQETLFQQQFAISVWLGMIGIPLIGSCELHPWLSEASYLQFLS
jgi:hypothetical protein